MRNKATKIILLIISGLILISCSLTKRVPDGKYLLEDNKIEVNGEKKNDEEIRDQLYQQPNSTTLIGVHTRLHLYNLAKPNADSSYRAWLERKPARHEFLTKLLSEKQVGRLGNSFIVSGLSNFFKKVGEPPVIVDEARVKKSRNRLFAYYYKKGYFRAKVGYKIDTVGNKKAVVNYDVITGDAYKIDSIKPLIESPLLDSLYVKAAPASLIKKGKNYQETDFIQERERLTTYFRNRGAYTFQQNYINYTIDTINTGHKANVELIVDNENVRQGDSTYIRPFKLYRISRVNIYTVNAASENQSIDSTTYGGFKIYSTGKLNYRPKAITDAIFITPGSMFSDERRVLTSRYLSNLRVFYYPSIQYVEDSTDVSGTSLISNIYLKPRERFRVNAAADFTHSNIQEFGIQGSLGLSVRNIFRGAEVLQLSTRGNIGSSRDNSIKDRSFFNILEYGADIKLTFPRIFFPLNTEKIIPKNMIPTTALSFGISRQQNIGLDKESFTGIFNYSWTPRPNRHTAKLDLFNIQYIRNVNPGNYFNVYSSSYNRLDDFAKEYRNQVPDAYFNSNNNLDPQEGTLLFIDDVKNGTITVAPGDEQSIRSIDERRKRLVENNLIVATNFTYTTTTRENINDKDFFIFKTKIEGAGNTLSLVSGLFNENKNASIENRTLFDVQYSQYLKGELDFIKHFDLRRNKVLAMRAFFGLAVPYGNSTSIPFTRSYFAGGSNDNRAWQSYSLGPGRSGSRNDFNEANLKLAYSAELRFNIFGQLNGAIFGDVGNIWNVFDEVDDPDYTFNGLSSLEDLAFGTGLGFRYDFNFFVVRFDLGFKTYNPANDEGSRWFREYNFANSVLNVGINYPF
ncbi:translocation and assembly module lipoprotein TamL [Flavobacterium rhizosphaerae]|uniref:BamA/TamA family outer membrane protein n=1 Tax=Flavobacterium rhizosphaerae TaxID=3163298 RepID=A0ABW8YVD0_9FLAO